MFSDFLHKKIGAREDSQAEDCETLLSDSKPSEVYRRPRSQALYNTGLALLFAISLCFATFIGARFGGRWFVDLDATCIRHVSQFSPVVQEVDIKYDVMRFNGSFMRENIFRQDAGPEVDAAWESLGVDYRAAAVPYELAEKSGLRLDQVKIREKYGGGFPANVEGLHHLHCLNLVRKSLYYNYDYYHALGKGAFKNEDRIVRLHVSHCLDILRQQLMCNVDVGVLGQIWVDPTDTMPFVDFNTRHKCKNFEAIRQWAHDHQLPEEPPADFLQPPRAGDLIYDSVP